MATERDPLFDILIGVDEPGTSELINQQLASISKNIKEIKVKMNIDSKAVGGLKEVARNISQEIERAASKVSTGATKGKTVLDPEVLRFREEEKQKVLEALEAYQHLDKVIKSVTRDSAGNVKQVVTEIDNLNGVMTKITSNMREDGTFANTVQTINVLEQQVKQTETALKSMSGEYLRLSKASLNTGETPEVMAKKAQLLRDIEKSTQAVTNAIVSSNFASEQEKNVYSSRIELSERLSNATIQEAQNLQENTRHREAAVQALKTYKQEMASAEKVAKGGFTGQSVESHLQAAKALEDQISGYRDLRVEFEAVASAFERNRASMDITKLSKDFEVAQKEAQGFAKSLQFAAERYQEASLKGNEVEVKKYANAVQEAGSALSVSAAKVETFGNELKRLGVDKSQDIQATRDMVRTQEELNQMASISETTLKRLADRFGQVNEKAESGESMKSLVQQLAAGKINAEEFTKAVYGQDAVLKKAVKSQDNYERNFRVLTVTTGEGTKNAREFTATVDKMGNVVRQLETPVSGMSRQVQGFAANLSEAAKKIATWGLSTKIVYGSWRAFKEGIGVIRDLDTQLTQIAVVQGTTRDSVAYLGRQYADTAFEMAKTVKEVATLNTELIRQGLALEDAASRADTIMKLSSTGMVSIEQSLQVVTAGVNAMGETHEKVADVILKASALSASSVEGLGEAFTKTASGAFAAGLSIEEVTALLSTMKEVTQEGDSQLGTSLKSMLARFNKVNEETGEINENLNQVQTAIESVGVKFLDSEGQIRSFYDILQDLSVGWGDLDKNTRAYIATQAAGVRQQNRFYAIMDNFNRVQAINNDLTSAAGTVQAAYATYMDSSEAAAQRLKAAVEGMWINFIDSAFIIDLTNLATMLVELVDKVGLLSVAFAALTIKILLSSKATKALILDLKAASFAQVAGGALNAAKSFLSTARAMGGLAAAGQVAAKGVSLVGGALATAGKFAIGLGPGIAIAAGLAIGTGKLITKISEHRKELRALAAEQEEYRKQSVEMYNSQSTTILNIQQLGEEYKTLSKKVSEMGGVYGLTSEEQERYYSVQKELVGILPELTHHEDMYGNIILDNVGTIGELVAAYQDLVRERMKEASVGYEDRIEEAIKIKNSAKEEADLIEKIAGLRKEQAKYDSVLKGDRGALIKETDPEKYQILLEEAREIINEISALEPAIVKLKLADADVMIPELRQAYLASFDQMSEELNLAMQQKPIKLAIADMAPEDALSFLNSIELALQDPANSIDIDGRNINLTGIDDVIRQMNEKLREGTLDRNAYEMEIAAIISSLENLAEGATGATKAAIEGTLETIGIFTNEAIDHVALTAEEMAAKSAEYADHFQKTYNSLQDTLTGFAEVQNMVTDSKVSDYEIDQLILSTYPQFMQFLGDRVGLENALGDAYTETANAQAEAYISMLENTNQFVGSNYGMHATMFADLGLAYVTDLENSKSRADAKGKVEAALISQLGKMWSQFFISTGEGIVFQAQAYEASAAAAGVSFEERRRTSAGLYQIQLNLNKKASEFSNIIQNTTFDTAKIKMHTTGIKDHAANIAKSAKKGAGAAKKGAEATKKMADSAKEAADAIKEMNEHMKGIQDQTKEVFDFALEYIEHIRDKQIEASEEAFDKAKKLIEDEYDAVRESIDLRTDSELKILETKENALKLEKETLEYTKKRSELQGDLVDLEYQAAIASLDSSAAGVSKRRTLEEDLASKREELEDLVTDRAEKLQTEAFARQRQFIQDQADWERNQAEITKETKMNNAQKVHTQEMEFLDQKYSAENNYLAARQATQTGMIANLHGDMIPLVDAFKELAIENGKFWTFFGQQDVVDFGSKVEQVLDHVKRLGFDTIQTWKEVKVAIDQATAAANQASSSSGSGGGGSSPSTGGRPTVAPTPTPPKPKEDVGSVKDLQRVINKAADYSQSDSLNRISVDGSFGPGTEAALKNMANLFFAQGKRYGSMNLYGSLMTSAGSRSVSKSVLDKIINLSFPKPKSSYSSQSTASSSRRGVSHAAYADGGKIDYTGPAQVHGSKKRPEYVFNYPQFKDLAKMIATHQFSQPSIQHMKPVAQATLSIDSFITVNGSIDKDTLPEFKRASQNALSQLTNKLKGWGN